MLSAIQLRKALRRNAYISTFGLPSSFYHFRAQSSLCPLVCWAYHSNALERYRLAYVVICFTHVPLTLLYRCLFCLKDQTRSFLLFQKRISVFWLAVTFGQMAQSVKLASVRSFLFSFVSKVQRIVNCIRVVDRSARRKVLYSYSIETLNSIREERASQESP
jgi:hypothetical protein